MRRGRPWLRWTGIGVGSIVAVVGIAVGVGLIWVHTDAGHRFVARKMESFVGGQIAGRVHVGGVTDVSMRGLHAHDVHFATRGGQDVLVVEDVDLELHWLPLLGGRFVASSARVRGARVIVRDAVGGIGLDVAFRSPHPDSNRPAPHDPPPVDIREIHATGVALRADVRGVPTIVVSGLRATVHVWIPYPGGPTRLTARGIAGHVVVETPMPIDLAVASGAMRFDSDARDRAEVDVDGVVDGVGVQWTNTVVQRRDGVHVASVLVVPDVGSALRETPLIAQASVAELASSGFDFSVRVGPRSPPFTPRPE